MRNLIERLAGQKERRHTAGGFVVGYHTLGSDSLAVDRQLHIVACVGALEGEYPLGLPVSHPGHRTDHNLVLGTVGHFAHQHPLTRIGAFGYDNLGSGGIRNSADQQHGEK